jgi:hypothetical protein
MAMMKLMARKHLRAPPRRNVVPMESHSDGQDAGYFPRTLRTVLLALGSSKPPLFIGTPRLLHGNSYLWCVRVVIYERPTLGNSKENGRSGGVGLEEGDDPGGPVLGRKAAVAWANFGKFQGKWRRPAKATGLN